MFDRVPSRDMSAVSLTRRRNCGAGQQIRILEENQSPAVNLRLSGCSLPFLRCCIFRKRPYQNIRFRLIRIRWSFLLRFLCILRLRQWQRMTTLIAWLLSGAGRMPSTLANCSAASNTEVCSTVRASISPSSYSWERVVLIP